MNKPFHLVAALSAASLLAAPATAAPEVRWLFWGEIRSTESLSRNGGKNAKAELYLRPEVTLRAWGKKADVVAYAIVSALGDQKRISYNNKVEAFLGVEGRYKISSAVRLKFGARVGTHKERGTGNSNSAAQLTMDAEIWKVWTPSIVTQRLPQGSRVVLSGWADLRYPSSLDPADKTNGLAQTALKLALDVTLPKSKIRVAPFAQVKAKMDLKRKTDLNYIEPALGVDLKYGIKDGEITFGVKAAHQRSLYTLDRYSGGIAYVSWYKRF